MMPHLNTPPPDLICILFGFGPFKRCTQGTVNVVSQQYDKGSVLEERTEAP